MTFDKELGKVYVIVMTLKIMGNTDTICVFELYESSFYSCACAS
jgi:hypothetical protein